MYSITDIKKGTVIELGGEPFIVTEYAQKQMGRGGSIVNVKVKSLLDGHVIGKTYKGNDKIAPASLERREVQFLYKSGEQVHFMDKANFEQFELSTEMLGDKINYLVEGNSVDAQLFKGRVVSIDLPIKLPLKVVYAEDVVKGDTQSTVQKSVELETGAKVMVPLFIKTGDIVIIDTRDGTYVERQKA